jgi:uracil-DNA glycosylase family 4
MVGPTAAERREELVSLFRTASTCTLCPLSEGRTQVVFGNGNADADLMFVGEAPGFHEDQQGLPFVGRAGNLLDDLLGGIGLERKDVFVANVLKCLRYNAMVQLGDGSWEPIGRLVRWHYTGEVMSAGADGRLVPRRVIGWHATPMGDRSVYRLTCRLAKRVGVELTGDHPVLTERGYVPVEQLRPDDRIATEAPSLVAQLEVAAVVVGGGAEDEPAEALSREAQRVVFDNFDLEDVTDDHRPEEMFFCLDVEDTHNFLTSAGVVHNCRPPGNRDPQPDEIDTCKPYLFKQVELIEPRVVCTLGNFATKLLTRSNRGITSVRGQPQVHELGARWVRIYPILHPAAALRTPRVREQLEEDISRLPALLAEPPPLPPGVIQASAAREPEPAASQLDLFG